MKNVELLTSTDLRVATAATRAGENPLRFGRKFDGPSRIRNGPNHARIFLGNGASIDIACFHLKSALTWREFVFFTGEAALFRMPFLFARSPASRGFETSLQLPKFFSGKIMVTRKCIRTTPKALTPSTLLGSRVDFARTSTRRPSGPAFSQNPENPILISGLRLRPERDNPLLNRVFTLSLHFLGRNVTWISVPAFFDNLKWMTRDTSASLLMSGLVSAVRSLDRRNQYGSH